MNILSLRQHAVLDAATVVVFALAPTVIGLEGAAATLSYILGAVHLIMSLLTASLPGAAASVVPTALHGLVEAAVGVILGILGVAVFDGTAGTFYIVMGAIILAVFVVTPYLGDRRS